MYKTAATLLVIAAGLGWAGRMDRDDVFTSTVTERLQGTFALAHMLIVEGHMGTADAEPVRDFRPDEPIVTLAQSVGQLRVHRTEEVGICTAGAIAPDLIITNHHCLAGGDRPGTTMEFVLGALEAGEGAARKLMWPPVEQDEALDYAILRVNTKLGAGAMPPLQALKLRAAQPGESLQMLHHPRFRPLMLTRAHCRVVHKKPVAGTNLAHTCRSTGGSSGSLLFALSDGAVVGLHYGTTTIGGFDQRGIATTATALLAKSAELQRIVGVGKVASQPIMANSGP